VFLLSCTSLLSLSLSLFSLLSVSVSLSLPPLFFYLVFLYFQPGTAADNLHPLHPNRNVPENDCGGSGRGRYYDVFTRISYYRGWIQRVVEQRYDGEEWISILLLSSSFLLKKNCKQK
jgi:hypothetical protein